MLNLGIKIKNSIETDCDVVALSNSISLRAYELQPIFPLLELSNIFSSDVELYNKCFEFKKLAITMILSCYSTYDTKYFYI